MEHVNNHHNYAPLDPAAANSPSRMYVQPSLTSDLMSRMAYSNEAVLKSLPITLTPPEDMFPKPPANLLQVAVYGSERPLQSWSVFEYLMSELDQPNRPPVLFAVDNLNHWMGDSFYRNSDHELIHAHQFTLVRHFLDALLGNTSLANGGIVLGATTSSNNPSSPTFSLLIDQLAALNKGISPDSTLFPLPAPYASLDPRVSNLLSTAAKANTKVTNLSGLSKRETRGLLDYFVKSGLLKDAMSDVSISEKWTLSGAGNIGELCKVGARARVDSDKTLTKLGTHAGVQRGQGEHVPKSALEK